MISGIIEVDKNGIPIKPQIILTNRNGTKIGTVYNAANIVMSFHMAQPNEISFDVYKMYDGTRCEVWDDLKDFRFIYVPYYDQWFEIHITINDGEGVVKHVSGFSVYESELSQLTLNEVEIGTVDDLDRLAKEDPNEDGSEDYSTSFYNPKKPNRSLLHRIFADKASHYSFFHVDTSLAKISGKEFSWDDTSIADALNEVAEEVECLFVFGEHDPNDNEDVLHRTVSVYDLKDVCLDCGYRGVEEGTCPQCGSHNYIRGYGKDTKIFVSRENLSSEIEYETNVDEVKNCFRLVAGDDDMTAAVRNVNPSGSQYIWYFTDEMLKDMSKSLRDAINKFNKTVDEYNMTKEFELPEDLVTKYNELVDKYNVYGKEFKKIELPVNGYSNLTNVYYNAEDLYVYIKTTLLPLADAVKETTAKEQLERLTDDAMSPIGLKEKRAMSGYYADSLIKERVKALVDTSRYRIYVNRLEYENLEWRGTIELKSYLDDKDTAITETPITVVFNEDYERYVEQQIEYAMRNYKNNKVGVVELFKLSDDDFKEKLHRYSIDGLNNLQSVCQACINVLIQEEIGNENHPAYNNFYVPYTKKLEYIMYEMQEREQELEVFTTRKEDENGAVLYVGDGLLDFIDTERINSAKELDLKEILTAKQWAELSSYRRDQTYSNDNYISDGNTSTEQIAKAREFLDIAKKELKKSATEQHSISGTLYNFLLLVDSEDAVAPDEYNLATIDGDNIVTQMGEYIKIHDPLFTPLVRSFELGNWIHLEVDDIVYKLRLTDFDIDFDSIENLEVTFSDVTTMNGFMGNTATLLKSALAISSSYGYVSRQASKGASANTQWNTFNKNGMSLDRSRIVSGVDESLLIDGNGILMRKMNDYGTDYDPEQVRIINKGLYYTNDGWETVGTGIGAFTYIDPDTGETINDYGVIAKTIIGKLILGENLGIYNESGSLKINENGFVLTSTSDGQAKDIFTVQKDNGDGTFDRYIYVNDNGEVIIDGNNVRVGKEEANQTITEYIDENMPIPEEAEPGESPVTVVIESNTGNIFKNNKIVATLTATVKRGNEDISDEIESCKWIRKDANGIVDESWTRIIAGNTIQITSADVANKAVFECEVTFTDTDYDGDEDEGDDGEDIP